MSNKRAKMDDGTLVDVFLEVAALYELLPRIRPSDYVLQEKVVAAVTSRMGINPIFRTYDTVEKMANLVIIDDRALPATKLNAVRALGKAASAPDTSRESIWLAVHSLREISLSMPGYAKAADKALKAVAVAHPGQWQEGYDSAGSYVIGSERNKLDQAISLDAVRRKIALEL